MLEDKKFRDEQRKDKKVYEKVMDKDREEEKKTFTEKIADKIAPEPVKPTSALEKKLKTNQTNALKKRLLVHEDEDSDSDGEEYTNPVAKTDTEKMKYVPPTLNLGAINDSKVMNLD